MRILIGIISVFTFFQCTPEHKEHKPVGKSYGVELDSSRYNVGLLLLPGTYNTELTAPMDIFQHTIYRDSIKSMNVFTISNTSNLVKTFEGLWIKPDFNYLESYPDIDILVIPASEKNMTSDLEDKALLDFIRKTSATAEWVTSHCDGAFLLAKSGVIEGRWSTTFPGDVDDYIKMFPELEVKKDVLFVRDGKFITSAGGAKSFEASLYLAEELYGTKVTKRLAQGLVINWDRTKLSYFETNKK